MTLLALLARLQKKHAFTLHVAHVNYGLRGRDSDRDVALVKKVCAAYAVPVTVLHSNEKPVANIEARLRDIRYRFFEKLRKQKKFDQIVTAHTMNDLAETLLLNLIRGAGVVGLSPFQREHSHLVRPLLSCTREEMEQFIKSEGLVFRIDRSNQSKRFTRNRIRHEILPLLETFNPNIIATLAKTAMLVGKSREKEQTTRRVEKEDGLW